MPYKIIFRSNTRLEIQKARLWYRHQQKGLEKQFSVAVKDTISRLRIHPEAFAVRYKKIRIIHTGKFPYSIHFYIDQAKGQIVITNIIHDSMDYQIA